VSELQKFLFDGLPVRGAAVRLDDAWTAMQAARAQSGGYPPVVTRLLGEMTAAALLMQANIKFNGAVILQVQGDGPVKLAVVEVQPDFAVRATATLQGDVPADATLTQLVNVNNQGRCAITLDPKDRMPGQQAYQGVVPLFDDNGEPIDTFSDILAHYMLQSEQLDTRLVLAANETIVAGLLVQRLPVTGEGNLAGSATQASNEDGIGKSEDFNRISTLAASLKQEELLDLDIETVLHRLFWDESLVRFLPTEGVIQPHFACSCSHERVSSMLRNLGVEEVESIIADEGAVSVGCEFCGAQYRFDPVDAARLFVDGAAPSSDSIQ
jgi:molecular chaperone Hsp33